MLGCLRWLGRFTALIIISVAALVVRLIMVPHTNADVNGVLIPWYEYIVQHGGVRALGASFSGYTPPYTYLLVAMTYLRPFITRLFAIKLISIVFDYVAAFVMYKLVRLKRRTGPLPVLGYAAVLFAPTVILNGSLWGQSDIIYATFLLLCVYFALRDRPLLTILSLGVSLAFKLQAIFLAPFLLLLLVRRKIAWGYALLPPAVYLFAILPAGLMGRPLGELLTIYVSQSSAYHSLTINAPNIYQFISGNYYASATVSGVVVAGLAGLGMALVALKSRVELTRELMLKAATLSVAMMPLLLPKMHERFFFPADLLSIGLAFYCPSLILVPIAFQCTSAAAYGPFLAGQQVVPLRSAGLVNALVVVLLLIVYLTALFPTRSRQAAAAPEEREPAQPDSA